MVAQLWTRGQYREIRRNSLRIILFALALLPVVLVAGIYGSEKIVVLMFAEEFLAAAPALTWLWVGAIFLSIGSLCTRALNSGHMHRSSAGIVIACVIINISLNIVLIPRLGTVGAAMATSISYFLLALASAVRLFTYLAGKMRNESARADLPG